MATAAGTAYERFWERLLRRIHSEYPSWRTPVSPPARNSLPFSTEISSFSYGVSFGHGELCSELYIKSAFSWDSLRWELLLP